MSSPWSWLMPILHTEPHIWTVLNNFQPQVLWMHPDLEWYVALFWATLDAAYLPFLLSLELIIVPLFGYNDQNRGELNAWAYLWTFCVVLYKFRRIWSGCNCQAVDWSSHDLWYMDRPVWGDVGCLIFTATLGIMFLGLGAFVCFFVYSEGTDGNRRGGFRFIVSMFAGAVAAIACMYPYFLELTSK